MNDTQGDKGYRKGLNMSVVCVDCGTMIAKSSLKTHQLTEKCRKYQELNKNCIIVCRKCGLRFEKHWHHESHHCGMDKVEDPLVVELRYRCMFYEKLVDALGIGLTIDWEEVRKGKFDLESLPKIQIVKDTRDSLDTDTETETIASVEEWKAREPPIKRPEIVPPDLVSSEVKAEILQFIQKRDDEMVTKTTVIEGYITAITQGKVENGDGEDYVYLIGSTLGEYIPSEYGRSSESSVAGWLESLKPFVKSKIAPNHDNREKFINGLVDSYCGEAWTSYILASLDIFDSRYPIKGWEQWTFTMDSTAPMTIEQICQEYTITHAFLPLKSFLTTFHVGTPFVRYVYHKDQYYRRESTGWVLDPWLLHLTAALANRITEVCMSLFSKAYKYAFGNNTYVKTWKDHAYMKPFIQVIRNIEMASTVFDVGHILRQELKKCTTTESIPIQRPSIQDTDEFAIISTRIHNKIPGVEMNNPYDILFDDCDPEVSQSFLTRYLKGLGSISSEYKPSVRFADKIKFELSQYGQE